MNKLVADGMISPLFIKENNLFMYQLLDRDRQLSAATRQATLNGLVRSVLSINNRARRIVFHGALRLADPAALNALFEAWVESNPNDVELMAMQVVFAAKHTPAENQNIRRTVVERCQDKPLRLDIAMLCLALCADAPSADDLELCQTLLDESKARPGGPRFPANTKIAEGLIALHTHQASDEMVEDLQSLLASTSGNSYQAYLLYAVLTALAEATDNQELATQHRQTASTVLAKINDANSSRGQDPPIHEWLFREVGNMVLQKAADELPEK